MLDCCTSDSHCLTNCRVAPEMKETISASSHSFHWVQSLRRDNGFDFSLSGNDVAHPGFPLSAMECLHLKVPHREASQATSGHLPAVHWTRWTQKRYSPWLTSQTRTTSFQQNQRRGAKFWSARFSSVIPHQSGPMFFKPHWPHQCTYIITNISWSSYALQNWEEGFSKVFLYF